jgi:cell division protein FtsA
VWLKLWSSFYRNQSLWTDPRKKLIAGIVLTGGGAQLKHIKQLVEYITGMDTRIGYPNEHLAGDSDEEFSSPLYAQQ